VTDKKAPDPENKEFWENLYQTKITPWDLGKAAPPFKSFLDSAHSVAPGTVAVLGCGAGYECLLFAAKGFTVTGIDFAPAAISATKEKFERANIFQTTGFVVQSDIFALDHLKEKFQYVVEHTCFCAIQPARRPDYARTVHNLLKIGGQLIGLWWLLDKRGGPPFAVDRSEIFELFSDFRVDLSYEPIDSVPDRQGKELFTLMTRVK
jgi:methyl halide transferase